MLKSFDSYVGILQDDVDHIYMHMFTVADEFRGKLNVNLFSIRQNKIKGIVR